MRPDQVFAASGYGGYSGATLRHPGRDRPGWALTCESDGRAWRIGHPSVLPTGRCSRPLAAPRHTTPLTGLPRGANLMRRIPPRIGGEAPRPAGSHPYTRAAAHRWDTAPDGRPPAAHTPSASPALRAPPAAAGQALHDRRPGPQCGWDGTAHTTAPPASGASAHAAASAGESPPRATSSVEARWIPCQPPRAARDR